MHSIWNSQLKSNRAKIRIQKKKIIFNYNFETQTKKLEEEFLKAIIHIREKN